MMPQELQNLLDELEASRASRQRAWENLQEMRWVLKQICEIELPPPARKTIDLEGRVVKDGMKKALRERQDALSELVEGHPAVPEAGRQQPADATSRRLCQGRRKAQRGN
jgi:hypothetical protein